MSSFRNSNSDPSGELIDRNRIISFSFDDKKFEGFKGDTLASALLASGQMLLGRSFKYHRPRGVWGVGNEEPNALVELGEGARREPNTRATVVELFDGLTAKSQNRWPSLRFDAMAINGLLSPLFVAGFYYKTFMWPAKLWELVYEPLIRRAAGLGRAATEADPDTYVRDNLFSDILIIGAGPTGLAAATTAIESGLRVVLVDEDWLPGGRLLFDKEQLDDSSAFDWVAATMLKLSNCSNFTFLNRTSIFGAFDHGVYAAVERRVDDLFNNGTSEPRQIFWNITAKRTILSTGAIERGIAFGDNDRPGIMAASAVRGYLNRYSVSVGNRPSIFTATDDGWRTAADLQNAGVHVAAIIDVRNNPGIDVQKQIDLTRTQVFCGARVTGTTGRQQLAAITILTQGNRSQRVATDALAVSGGWNPTLHISSHKGHKPKWNSDLGCFEPDRLPRDMLVAGAARGVWDLGLCLKQGAETAKHACENLGAAVTIPNLPKTNTRPAEAVALWHVSESTSKCFIDLQHDVTTLDVKVAAQEGFTAVEHLKRYTTLGMATDQGKTSNVLGLAILAQVTGKSITDTGTTVFRPPYVPVALGAIAGHAKGKHLKPTRLPPSQNWATANGASFVEAGLWLRAQWYKREGEKGWRNSVDREALTVRSAVGVCDVSTLGKIEIVGPDSAVFLDFIYTNTISTLGVGRIRYGVMLRDDGFVFDDGTVARLAEDRFLITTTTINAARVLQHMEFCHQVYKPEMTFTCVSVTDKWAQFSVAGPLARDLISAIADEPVGLSNIELPHMTWREIKVAGGIFARLYRISFSGELAYEISVGAPFADQLIRMMMGAGQSLGISAYGLEALGVLRIEKGHIAGGELNGQVTAHDLGLGGLVSKKKDFIGRVMSLRPALQSADRQVLVGLKSLDNRHDFKPGAHLFMQNQTISSGSDLGHVTSTCFSPHLNTEIGLGLLQNGRERIGQILIAHDPVRTRDRLVEVCNPIFVDPLGGRTKT